MLDLPSASTVANWDRRRQIETLARQILAARVEGDARELEARLAPDFAYRARGAWPMWPYHAGPIGRAKFVEAARRISAEFELLAMEVHEFLIDGDSAALHATSATRNRDGAFAECDSWIYLRLRGDLIVGAAVYVDVARAATLLPAGVVEAYIRDAGRGGRGPSSASPSPAPAESGGPVTDARYRKWMEHEAGDLFALRAKGDFEAMLARFAPDFIYNPRGDWTRAPLMVGRCDRATFAESLRQVIVEFEDLGGPTHELVVDGDRVAVHRTIRLRNRGAGEIADVDEWVCLRIREGLIVEMASYVDNGKAARLEWPDYSPPR